MQREEAVAVLKRIIEECKVLDGSDVSLNSTPSSQGYQLQIKIPLDETTKRCLSDILDQDAQPKPESKKK